MTKKAYIKGEETPKEYDMEIIYTEQANGHQEYWIYSDGQRVFISLQIANKMKRQGARLINI